MEASEFGKVPAGALDNTLAGSARARNGRIPAARPVSLAVFALLAVPACGRGIKGSATYLCETGQLNSPNLAVFPEEEVAKHVRAADIRHEKATANEGALLAAGIGQVFAKVRKETVSCEVLSSTEVGNKATVVVKANEPDVTAVGGLVGVLQKAGQGEDALRKAMTDAPKVTREVSLTFAKEGDAWRADFQLPEAAKAEAEAEARKGEANRLVKEAEELLPRMEFDKVLAKLEGATKLDPDREGLKEAIATAREAAGGMVDRWCMSRETDKLTDQKTVVARTAAEDEIKGAFGRKFPHLVYRCLNGEVEFYIDAQHMIESNLWGSTVWTYRIDKGEQKQVSGNRSADFKGLFAKGSAFADDVRNGRELIVGIALLNTTPQAITFDVTGASKAFAEVDSACGKGTARASAVAVESLPKE